MPIMSEPSVIWTFHRPYDTKGDNYKWVSSARMSWHAVGEKKKLTDWECISSKIEHLCPDAK